MTVERCLVTGASGEIGFSLIEYLKQNTTTEVVALDRRSLSSQLAAKCSAVYEGDILDWGLLEELGKNHQVSTIYHLASILSTRAERDPFLAHRVNVEGTLQIIKLARALSGRLRSRIKIIYPSSIAVYGMNDIETKNSAGLISEEEHCSPVTIYGSNKLYCEKLGAYFTHHCYQDRSDSGNPLIDFRSIRFPGLISATTLPTGGTSDYGPEMIHYAARGERYDCFVRPDTSLPFMVMPDAVRALVQLTEAPANSLSIPSYNVTAFSITARRIHEYVNREFSGAEINYVEDARRQQIIDSWPAGVDDTAARRDWNWHPGYDEERAFVNYLIPGIKQRYALPA